jgi:hypothetical protein
MDGQNLHRKEPTALKKEGEKMDNRGFWQKIWQKIDFRVADFIAFLSFVAMISVLGFRLLGSPYFKESRAEDLEEAAEKTAETLAAQVYLPLLGYRQNETEEGVAEDLSLDLRGKFEFLKIKNSYTYDKLRKEFNMADFSAADEALAKVGLAEIKRFDISVKKFDYIFDKARSELSLISSINIRIQTKKRIGRFLRERTKRLTKSRFMGPGKNITVDLGNISWDKEGLAIDVLISGMVRNGDDRASRSYFLDEETEIRAESLSID